MISDQNEKVRFAVACFDERHVDTAREMLGVDHPEIELYVGKTPELIRSASCCIACSGSVSLEFDVSPQTIDYSIQNRAIGLVDSRAF